MSKKKSDLTAKAFALIIAIILWSYVMGSVNPDRTADIRNITVSLSNISALDRQSLEIMEPQEVSVNVRVAGRKNEVDKFFSSGGVKNILAQVDLSGYSEGQKKVPVTVNLVNQEAGVRIVSWEPRDILFTFDKKITKEQVVTFETTGILPEGYVLGNISSKLKTILLKGPRSWVNEVTQVLAKIDLTNRTSTEVVTLPLKILNDQGNEVRGVDKEPNTIDITVPILRKVSIPIELQTINELPENLVITDIVISPTSVFVQGSEEAVNLTKLVTKPIDVNTLLDKKAVDIELDLPEGVELSNPNEKMTIFYKIEEVIEKDYSFTPEEIKIINLDQDLVVENLDDNTEIVVTIKGLKSILEVFDKNKLNLHVDLIDIKEGSHIVNLITDQLDGITMVQIAPNKFNVNINKR